MYKAKPLSLHDTAATNAPAFITVMAICEVFVGFSVLRVLTRTGALGGMILKAISYLAAGHI